MTKIATLSIIDDKRLLPGVLSFIDSIAGKLDFPQTKLMKFKMAYETMISGRIKSAYSDGGMIDIDLTLTPSMLEVSVRDKGAPSWQSKEYNPEAVDKNAEGLENYLVASMCDCAGSEKLGRDGQREFVRLNFPSLLEGGRAKRNAEVESAPESVEVSIKETTCNEKDIIAAITCIYDEYRYTYGYERLYYPDSFKELISAGKLRSFLAVGSNGETAGHYCLSESEDFPTMPEWATVVIRRPFRGRHIFDRMCGHGVEMAKKYGARAVMMQPTAYHTATQRVAERHGYTATGFLFQYINSDMESEYNTDGRRLDLAVAVKFLTENPKGFAYIPKEHKVFIKELYKKLGADYEFPAPFQPEQKTRIRHEINSLMKSGRIVVMQAGSDIKSELAHTTSLLRRNKAEMIELLVSMNDPAAPFAYDDAKDCGYFFTGILPGGSSGDYLIMQNLLWGEVDASSVATTGEYTEVMRYLTKTVDCIKG